MFSVKEQILYGNLQSIREYITHTHYLDINVIKKSYLDWVSENVYLCLRREHAAMSATGRENSYYFVLASKRGNSEYVKRTYERIRDLHQVLTTNYIRTYEHTKSYGETNTMFLTVTIDRKKFGNDIREVEKNISKYWDTFIKRLKREFGYKYYRGKNNYELKEAKILKIKSNEYQKAGWVHIHAILIFPDKLFYYYLHKSKKDNTYTWRFNDEVWQKVKNAWEWGNSDLQAVVDKDKKNYQIGSLNYALKYVVKQVTYDKMDNIITLALNWAFKHRSFSISKEISDKLKELHEQQAENTALTKALHNSPFDDLDEWVCLGTISQKTFFMLTQIKIEQEKPPDIIILDEENFKKIELNINYFSEYYQQIVNKQIEQIEREIAENIENNDDNEYVYSDDNKKFETKGIQRLRKTMLEYRTEIELSELKLND